MRADERANAWKCTAGEGLFGIGIGMVAAVTVVPLLLRQLGAGEAMIGLASGIAAAGWALLQPAGILVLGRRSRRKLFLVSWSFWCIVPTCAAIGLVVCLVGLRYPALCAVLVLVFYAIWVCGDGISVPLWLDWHSRLFGQGIRGRAIGMMAGASSLGASVGALVAGAVRSYFGFPANYALLFLAAAVFAAASLAAIMSVQEPAEMARPSAALGTRDLLTLFRRSLGERNFRNYLAGRILLILGGGASGFYAIHFGSTEGGGLAESTIITLGMFLTLPQAIASYLFGRLGDRVGHKRGVVMGALAQAGSLAAAYLGTGAWACVASFALLGVTWASGWVSHSNMLFETCPHDHRAAHITVSNTVLSPLLFLVPLGMGRLMESVVGIRNGIGLSLIPSALGVLWMLLVVKDPRATRAAGGQSAAAAVAS